MVHKNFAPLIDGTLVVYELGDIGEPGGIPKQGLIEKWRLRYDERVVGMNRYWRAQQVSATITRLVRCHRLDAVTTLHVVVMDGEQYNIRQIQIIPDLSPQVMDLSLERRVDKYPVAIPEEPDDEEEENSDDD